MNPQPLKEQGRTGRKEWSDERLVRECLHGNEAAWSHLIDKYKSLIYSIPVKHRAPPDVAGEIFQQVCVELLTALPRLRDTKSLAAWLITVTSNKCVDWSRLQHRYHPIDSHMDGPASEQTKLPDSLLLALEREQILRETFPRIATRCQTLIRMLFFDSPVVPYEEAARRLGLAKGSIGFIRMRCLRQLRLLLEKKGFR